MRFIYIIGGILVYTIFMNAIDNRTYWYDTNQSYSYDFNSTNANINISAIKGGIVQVNSNLNDGNCSTFLKLNVHKIKKNSSSLPIVNITYKDHIFKHSLEIGAEGIRYLNISYLNLNKGSIFKIEGDGVDISDQNITFVKYQNIKLENKKILILSPHPDDAEIAAFGLYSKYPKNTYIATITSGDAGPYRYDELFKNKKEHFLEKGRVRTWNSISVPMFAKVSPEHCVNLGFFDARLKVMAANKEKEISGLYTNILDRSIYRQMNFSSLNKGLSGKSTWKSLVNNLVYLLNEIKPDIIVTPYPALDSHNDHKYTTIALLEALQLTNIKKGKLFLYSNHCILSESYPYGKRGESIDLPPYFNNPFYFDSIYSSSLTEKVQKDKIFALEAMNDLRPDMEWYFAQDKHKKHFWIWHGQNVSYFRRAVRKNELFFVVDIKNIVKNKDMYKNKIIQKLIKVDK